MTLLVQLALANNMGAFSIASSVLHGTQVLLLNQIREAITAEPRAEFTIKIKMFDGGMYVDVYRDDEKLEQK